MRVGNPGIDTRRLVTIGKVTRVHGLCGEVKVQSLSDVPGRFETLERVLAADRHGALLELAVRASRRAAGDYLVAFEGITTPDRKSTRLNSSHSQISYAVFCLKKKNNSKWVTALCVRHTYG